MKNLLEELLSVDISKQQQTSDWGAETLSDAQIDYAASDVLYLHKLKAELDRRLEREGRAALAQACFTFLPERAIIANAIPNALRASSLCSLAMALSAGFPIKSAIVLLDRNLDSHASAFARGHAFHAMFIATAEMVCVDPNIAAAYAAASNVRSGLITAAAMGFTAAVGATSARAAATRLVFSTDKPAVPVGLRSTVAKFLTGSGVLSLMMTTDLATGYDSANDCMAAIPSEMDAPFAVLSNPFGDGTDKP